jgi:hypothetical protein
MLFTCFSVLAIGLPAGSVDDFKAGPLVQPANDGAPV